MDEPIPDGLELTPFSDAFRSDPYVVYRKLREVDPVHRDAMSFFGEAPSWTITGFDQVNALLTDSRLSADSRRIGLPRDPRAESIAPGRAPDMMTLDDPDHARLRGLVHKAFTPSSVQRLAPRIEEIACALLDPLAAEARFDAIEAFAKPLPTIVIAEFIGVDSAHHSDFKRWTDSLLLQGLLQPTPAQWQEIAQADTALRNYMKAVIASRRQAPKDDLISRLIAARDQQDKLSEDEVVGMCTLLIGAGNFTTTDLIGNALLALLNHPEQCRDFEQRLDAVVEETLRFDPPSLVVRRYAIDDIAIAGKNIERGSVVNLVIGAANHDPARFDRPDQFDTTIARPPHIAFGRGIHHCLGAPLARLEARIAVMAFFGVFPNASLLSVKRNKTLGFRGCRSLVVATS